jgi:hypothetical protein
MDRKWLWILGASDPEMERIEQLLRQVGEPVAYASIEGLRVRPETAYQHEKIEALLADKTRPELERYDMVLLVECALSRGDSNRRYVAVDHHKPGDVGYGRPPEDFFPASSIGQVVSWLAQAQLIGRAAGAIRAKLIWNEIWRGPEMLGAIAGEVSYQESLQGRWVVFGYPDGGPSGRWAVEIPQDLVFAAAADHCLAAAYRGACPGVHPDKLMRWRVESRARFQGRPVEEVLADVERARQRLRAAPRLKELAGAADLRGEEIPELPEAAAREGIAFVGTPRPGRDGRRKMVLQCAGPEHLAAWPSWAKAQGLVDLYGGDPTRGFAGGFFP